MAKHIEKRDSCLFVTNTAFDTERLIVEFYLMDQLMKSITCQLQMR
jgi:hypothetical protein